MRGAALLSNKQLSFDHTATAIPAQEIELVLTAKPGDMVLIAVAVEFETYTGDKTRLDPKWLPAAAIALGRLRE